MKINKRNLLLDIRDLIVGVVFNVAVLTFLPVNGGVAIVLGFLVMVGWLWLSGYFSRPIFEPVYRTHRTHSIDDVEQMKRLRTVGELLSKDTVEALVSNLAENIGGTKTRQETIEALVAGAKILDIIESTNQQLDEAIRKAEQ